MLKSIYLTYFMYLRCFTGGFYVHLLKSQNKARQLGTGHLEMLCRAGVFVSPYNLFHFFITQETPLEITHQKNHAPNEENKWLTTNHKTVGAQRPQGLTYRFVHWSEAGASGAPGRALASCGNSNKALPLEGSQRFFASLQFSFPFIGASEGRKDTCSATEHAK